MSSESPWRFYVYALLDRAGSIQYVGKGSGDRLKYQRRRYSLNGIELLRCKTEKEAYRQERLKIRELSPALNQNLGGGGSWCTPIRAPRQPRDKFTLLCEKIGTRAYAARIILAVARVRPDLVDMSKIDAIRQVAWPQM